ncbi:MAG: glycosyltransferase family 4 protein [Chitinispirillia bacterium]|nr:glycosyltransferase family 4 protein [Chitinispirillia bacterium]
MKIAYICSGTGDAFYCENCVRDNSMISGLRALGHDVVIVPMYLPLKDNDAAGGVAPVLFGAVRIYLMDKFPFLKRLPEKLLRSLDHRKILDMAASFAGSTRAGGNEGMTISMIEGTDGPFADEFDKSAEAIKELKPDAIFLSNAFLLGIASAIKSKLSVPIVCMLQDEHVWVDASAPEYRDKTWKACAEKSQYADMLCAHSNWFRDKIAGLMDISTDKISVTPFGIDPNRYTLSTPSSPASIGYISRLCVELGMGTLADAYCQLIKNGINDNNPPVLEFCGGYTKDDMAVINTSRKKINTSNGRMVIHKDFSINSRAELLSRLSLLSVPTPISIAFGGFITEAMASGVPVVQPDCGGFTEVINETGAGLLYSPNTPEALADALERVMRDDDLRKSMSEAGRKAVVSKYNNIEMARGALAFL